MCIRVVNQGMNLPDNFRDETQEMKDLLLFSISFLFLHDSFLSYCRGISHFKFLKTKHS